MSIYLDYNASTPVDERVLNSMVDVYRNYYGNADSRTHDFGENARIIVEKSRESVANLLNVKKDEVFFTSGATESDNIAILGLREYAEKNNKRHIITTAIEHKAVLEPLKYLSRNGFDITFIKPDEEGKIAVCDVVNSIRQDTLMVSVMHVNNETGIIQPVQKLGEILSDTDILFHVDAAQSCGKLVDELRNLKYDMLSASAHKMYGPQGIGALILKKKRYKLPPVSALMFGGQQEHGLRPGTVPTALIAGFGEACSIATREYKSNYDIYCKNKNEILSLLEDSGLKYHINGSVELSIANTVNIAFDGINSEAFMLATKRYCGLSNGSACNSNNYKISYVLEAMGLDADRIRSSIRMSWGKEPLCQKEVKNMLLTIKQLI